MFDVKTSSADVAMEHIKILTSKTFEETAAALERQLPIVDNTVWARLLNGDVASVKTELENGPDLAIFEKRDHGSTDQLVDGFRKCFQYEIGNPLTASKMTSKALGAGLYAPLRVVLYETDGKGSAFEYDKPSLLFGQYGSDQIKSVAEKLDVQIKDALTKAAS